MLFPTIRWVLIGLLLAIAIACGLWGGGDNRIDVALVRAGIAARAAHPSATTAGMILNIVGGVTVTIGLAIAAAIALWRSGRVRDAGAFIAILISGRLVIEAIKLLVRRARPALDPHPVVTHSLSFPSAHAANSMMFFGALALVSASPRHCRPALITAVLASVLVGASRPLLGVHWPSDVVAGWAFGAAWLLLWWTKLDGLARREVQHDVVRGHRAPGVER